MARRQKLHDPLPDAGAETPAAQQLIRSPSQQTVVHPDNPVLHAALPHTHIRSKA